MESTSAFVFGCLVLVVNLKLFVESTEHTWQSVTIISLSILTYFGVFVLLSSIPVLEEFNTFTMLFTDPIAYLAMFFFLFSYFIVYAGALFVSKTVQEM